MKAVIWTNYGAPDVLKIGEVEKPIPKDDDILIKVMATTVSLGDCEIRSLTLPLAFKIPIKLVLGFSKPRKRITLGQEFSGIVVAIAAAVVGALRVVGYFMKKKGEEGPSLISGLLLISLAIFIFVRPTVITTILYAILGFVIIVNGFMKLQASIRMKRQNEKYWGAVLISALITLALGFIAIFSSFGPATLIILIGISMIVGGVLDLIAAIFLRNKIKEAVKE